MGGVSSIQFFWMFGNFKLCKAPYRTLLAGELLDPAKVHPETFRGCSHKFYPPTAHLRSIERHNKPKTAGRQKRSLQRMTKRKMNSLSKLAELGISYKLPDSVRGTF